MTRPPTVLVVDDVPANCEVLEAILAPRGYAADHPRLDLLRCKSLTVSRRHALGPWLHRPKAGRTIREELQAAARIEGIASIDDVRWGVLETSGQISFIPKS